MERKAHLFDASVVCTCTSERDMEKIAGDFAATLRPGEVVAISGALGAGKTTFARAIVRMLHGRDEGSSPSFTFRHRYDGDPPIEHLDFYRIETAQEIVELGLEEAFDGEAVVLVEWWRNAAFLLPEKRWEVEIEGTGDAPRRVTILPP